MNETLLTHLIETGSHFLWRVRTVLAFFCELFLTDASVYIHGYILSAMSMLICVVGFDYYRQLSHGYRSHIRRILDLMIPLFIIFIVAAPFFTPFAALPLAQEVKDTQFSSSPQLFIFHRSGFGAVSVNLSPLQFSSRGSQTPTSRPRSLSIRFYRNHNSRDKHPLPRNNTFMISTSLMQITTKSFGIAP
jgi:hypothetical protein